MSTNLCAYFSDSFGIHFFLYGHLIFAFVYSLAFEFIQTLLPLTSSQYGLSCHLVYAAGPKLVDLCFHFSPMLTLCTKLIAQGL